MTHGKRMGWIVVLWLALMIQPKAWGQLLDENFDYPAGDNLSDHGWTIQRGSDEKILVCEPGLEYPGYILSGIGNAASVAPVAPSTYGEEVSKTFAEQTSGTVYVSFLLQISGFNPDPDDQGLILYLGPPAVSIFDRQLSFYVTPDVSGNLAFGISKVHGMMITDFLYTTNTTYFIVLAYTFNTSSDTDDVVSLWIDPPVGGPAPAPDAENSDTGADAASLGGIMLTRLDEDTPTARIDGIRIATDWSFATSPVHEPDSRLPRVLALHQNYPNPFNPATSISYSLPDQAGVRLTVFDALGHEIETLVNGTRGAGRHVVTFDAAKHPSAFYFYRLNVDGRIVDTRRMLLMK